MLREGFWWWIGELEREVPLVDRGVCGGRERGGDMARHGAGVMMVVAVGFDHGGVRQRCSSRGAITARRRTGADWKIRVGGLLD